MLRLPFWPMVVEQPERRVKLRANSAAAQQFLGFKGFFRRAKGCTDYVAGLVLAYGLGKMLRLPKF
jgi:hypothetical protein